MTKWIFRMDAEIQRLASSPLPTILFLLHNRMGGVQKHVDELTNLIDAHANSIVIMPIKNAFVEVHWTKNEKKYSIKYDVNKSYDKLLQFLRVIGISRIHFHHTLGLPIRLFDLPQDLTIPFDFTAHDYYMVCPQTNLTKNNNQYCGEIGLEDCRECLQHSPAPGNLSIEDWRDRSTRFLSQADRIICPSFDTAKRYRRYYPNLNVIEISHPKNKLNKAPTPWLGINGSNHKKLCVAVLGALVQIKGADILEQCAIDAKKRNLSIEFILIGHAYRHLLSYPKSNLIVHGKYEDNKLIDLLDHYKPDIILFPAIWPETYSYTLSTALESGCPILSTRLGAFSERLVGRASTWLYDLTTTPAELNNFLSDLWINFNGVLSGNDRIISASQIKSIDAPTRVLTAEEYLLIYLNKVQKIWGKGAVSLKESAISIVPISEAKNREKGLRHNIINLLYLLRNMPIFRLLVQSVPSNIQRRIKNFILGF